jgi:hypothetical protein
METIEELTRRYNYDEFTLAKALPWLNFGQSPSLGQKALDFPLWHLDGRVTRLSEMWSSYVYTIVEFGSFT